MKPALLLLLLATSAHALDLPATKPEKGIIHRWVRLPATLAPNQQVTLHARVSGFVKSIAVDKGDMVKNGQTLVAIEVPELLADQKKVQAELDLAKIEFDRATEAAKKAADLVVPQTLDAAKGRLSTAKADMERIETMLGFASITAPFDGQITDRKIDPGSYVEAGRSPLVTLVDASTIRVQIPVTELECPLATVGKPVKVQIESLGSAAFEGTITRRTGALDEATRTMLVEADLKNTDGRLLPGMYAIARIAVEKHDSAMVIPTTGLVMEKTNAFVFKHVDGKAMKTPVKIGFNDGEKVEILDGVAGSDEILLPDKTALTPGQAVTVIKP